MKLKKSTINALILSSAMAITANAVGVSSDESELRTPTLGDKSAYTLTNATSEGDFTITKYLEDTNLKPTLYDVNIKTIGDSSQNSVIYFAWEINEDTGDRTLSVVETEGESDFAYYYDSSTKKSRMSQSSTSSTGDISGNFIGLTQTSTYTYGGAIYLNVSSASSSTSIGDITGDFISNYASSYAYGGAIYLSAAKASSTTSIGDITGDFIGNYAILTTSAAYGGAIYGITSSNGATVSIDSITGDFIGNYVDAKYGYGGAIYWSASKAWSATSGASTASIGDITGDFIGNYISASAYGSGGAIYHFSNGTSTIGNITGDFIENYISAGTYGYGGAIFNATDSSYGASVKIGNITGDFIGNYISGTSYLKGGAIYNYANSHIATIGNITGDFIGNAILATSESTSSNYGQGGAIYNSGSGGKSSYYNSDGTYSYTYDGDATIGNITGNFIDNYVLATSSSTSNTYAQGGAIYNYASTGGGTATIGTIDGSFESNYVSSASSYAQGGAIYNYSTTGIIIADGSTKISKATIGNITGSFTENSATSVLSYAQGGAIYNAAYYASSTSASSYPYVGISTIGNITGDFSSNTATSTSSYAQGGAIYNIATNNYTRTSSSDYAVTIGDITGSFSGNSATSTDSYAQGGAIYNVASFDSTYTSSSYTYAYDANIGDIIGDFTGNYVSGTTAQGGAIYNSANFTYSAESIYLDDDENDTYVKAEIKSIEGNIIGNYALASDTAQGGAIYNSGSVTFTSSENTSYSYLGNFATTDSTIDSNDDANGGFLYNDGGAVTFNTAEKSSITIGDGTAGYDSIAGTGTITKTGTGTLTVNSSMQSYSGSLNVEAGTMAVNNVLGASEISIGTSDSSATLSLAINTTGYTLTSDTLSTISFNNTDSVLKLITTSTTAGVYTLSANNDFTIANYLDNIIAYGGTFDGEDFTVTVSQEYETGMVVTGSSNVTITSSDSDVIDVIISTSSVYNTDTSAITISSATEITNDVTASGESSSIYSAILSEVQLDFTVLSSWDFDIKFEDSDDSVVVSFLVGEGLDLSNISLYHTDDDNVTTDVSSSIISYEDGYLSFDANSFSSYTAIAVPEPSTYAMIFGALALGLAVYRRRK